MVTAVRSADCAFLRHQPRWRSRVRHVGHHHGNLLILPTVGIASATHLHPSLVVFQPGLTHITAVFPIFAVVAFPVCALFLPFASFHCHRKHSAKVEVCCGGGPFNSKYASVPVILSTHPHALPSLPAHAHNTFGRFSEVRQEFVLDSCSWTSHKGSYPLFKSHPKASMCGWFKATRLKYAGVEAYSLRFVGITTWLQ